MLPPSTSVSRGGVDDPAVAVTPSALPGRAAGERVAGRPAGVAHAGIALMPSSPKWADLIGKDLAYVVLRKGNRLQVILRPTGKQLRRRGRRAWALVAAADTAPPELP